MRRRARRKRAALLCVCAVSAARFRRRGGRRRIRPDPGWMEWAWVVVGWKSEQPRATGCLAGLLAGDLMDGGEERPWLRESRSGVLRSVSPKAMGRPTVRTSSRGSRIWRLRGALSAFHGLCGTRSGSKCTDRVKYRNFWALTPIVGAQTPIAGGKLPASEPLTSNLGAQTVIAGALTAVVGGGNLRCRGSEPPVPEPLRSNAEVESPGIGAMSTDSGAQTAGVRRISAGWKDGDSPRRRCVKAGTGGAFSFPLKCGTGAPTRYRVACGVCVRAKPIIFRAPCVGAGAGWRISASVNSSTSGCGVNGVPRSAASATARSRGMGAKRR